MKRLLRALALTLPLLSAACATTAKQNTIYLIKVEKGDTLAMIARKYDTTAGNILDINGMDSGIAPKVGAVLRVAPGPAGLVAGADAMKKIPGPKIAKKLPSVAPELDADSPEFTEEDIPDDGGKKKGGLLFGNQGADSKAFFRWPLQGTLGSKFGQRGGRPHRGIDVRAKYGADIGASGPGVIEFAGRQNGFGRLVIIRHGKWKSYYGHLSSIGVSTGERVARGAVIGQVGTSGNASGPHLHFEIHDPAGKAVDPLTMLGGAKLLSKN